MLSKDEISTASAVLDELDIAMLVTVIKSGGTYKANPPFYNDLTAKIEATDGTTEAKMLNAIKTRIESLGVGEVELRGGDEGVYYSQNKEREALINYAISIIYDAPFDSLAVDLNNYLLVGNYGVSQRLTDLD